MGCLKSLVRRIIIIALIIAFFTLGGWAFLKDKINKYKNPARDEFVKTEKEYADFSSVGGDYQLRRNFNILGYKKVTAKYLPTGQKINIINLKDENKLLVDDFKTNEIDNKINSILDKLKDSFITFEDFEIIKRGNYNSQNKTIPYIVFSAKVRNMPFKNVIGTMAIYTMQTKKSKNSTKLILSIVDKKAYNPIIVSDFVNSLKFEPCKK